MTLYPVEGLKHFWFTEPEEDLSFEELLAEISARLVVLPADQVDRGIEDALRLICNSLKIDESTIYLREIENPDIFVLSYVLRDPALPPPPKIKFTATEHFPWCNRKLIANEIIYLPYTQSAPEEAAVDKASWEKFNVVSALVIPLNAGVRPLGFWGIDSTSERREWTERLQKQLRIIAGVFASTIERTVSERQLSASEMRLRLAAETAGAGFWTIDMEAGVVWATTKLQAMFGLVPSNAFGMATFLAVVHPDDRKSVEEAIDAISRGEEATVEYRLVPSSDTLRWVMSRGSRHVFDADGRSLLMGITFDITDRHSSEERLRMLGVRLIDAQEQERKRIARELHDNIGQQLAVISIHLGGLQSADYVEPAKLIQRIEELKNKMHSLCSDVEALSHQLHSSSLDHLGLVPAVARLCKEISEHQQAQIHFTVTNMPQSVPPDVSLALFRITQESLHNALKYSGVREFIVRLNGTETHIELLISDNGAGFDVNEAKNGHGIGLISMQERISAVNGTLCIESQPMKGTQVNVRVPLTANRSNKVSGSLSNARS